MRHNELLEQLYFGEHEGSYATATRLLAAAKRHNKTVTLSDVVSFLRKQKSYQEHRQVAKRKRYPKYISKRFIEVGLPKMIIQWLIVNWYAGWYARHSRNGCYDAKSISVKIQIFACLYRRSNAFLVCVVSSCVKQSQCDQRIYKTAGEYIQMAL